MTGTFQKCCSSSAIQEGWYPWPGLGVYGREEKQPRAPDCLQPDGLLAAGIWELDGRQRTLIFYLSSGFHGSQMEQAAAELRSKKGSLCFKKKNKGKWRVLLHGLIPTLFWVGSLSPISLAEVALANFSNVGSFNAFHIASFNTTGLFNRR